MLGAREVMSTVSTYETDRLGAKEATFASCLGFSHSRIREERGTTKAITLRT